MILTGLSLTPGGQLMNTLGKQQLDNNETDFKSTKGGNFGRPITYGQYILSSQNHIGF